MPIRKDKAGRYHVEVCVARQRIHRRCPEGASASDAKELEAELRRSLKANRKPTIPGNPLLTDLLGYYTETYALRLKGWKEAQYHAYRIAAWVEGKRAADTRTVAATIISELHGHYAPATINKSLNALSRALSLAWDRGETDQDYSAMIRRLPENNQRERVLTMKEVQRIADKASASVRAAIWIALYTGLRRSEVAGLHREHIDLEAGMLTIPAAMTKSQRIRSVPIAAPVRPWLEQVPLGIGAQGFKSGFVRARIAAGIPDVTIHDLRRSCGTMLIRAGVDLYVVSKILGHSSVTVTQQRYAHLATKQLSEGMRKAFG
jgi:integrase